MLGLVVLEKSIEFGGSFLAPKHEQNRFSWDGVGKDEYEVPEVPCMNVTVGKWMMMVEV